MTFSKLILICIAVLTMVGCGHINRQPSYNVTTPMTAEPFKRFEQYPSRDYLRHYLIKNYSKVEKPLTKRLSEDQQDVLARHGQPQYTRSQWRATTGELVDEWAYWDRQVVVQFVERELVWEGELTDMDDRRIRYGRPETAWRVSDNKGVVRDFWEYQGMFQSTRGIILTFTDEILVSEETF